jgi:hypothetical protein
MREGFGSGVSGVLPTRVNDSALSRHTSPWDWTMPKAVMSLRPRKARGRSTALPELGNCDPFPYSTDDLEGFQSAKSLRLGLNVSFGIFFTFYFYKKG